MARPVAPGVLAWSRGGAGRTKPAQPMHARNACMQKRKLLTHRPDRRAGLQGRLQWDGRWEGGQCSGPDCSAERPQSRLHKQPQPYHSDSGSCICACCAPLPSHTAPSLTADHHSAPAQVHFLQGHLNQECLLALQKGMQRHGVRCMPLARMAAPGHWRNVQAWTASWSPTLKVWPPYIMPASQRAPAKLLNQGTTTMRSAPQKPTAPARGARRCCLAFPTASSCSARGSRSHGGAVAG